MGQIMVEVVRMQIEDEIGTDDRDDENGSRTQKRG